MSSLDTEALLMRIENLERDVARLKELEARRFEGKIEIPPQESQPDFSRPAQGDPVWPKEPAEPRPSSPSIFADYIPSKPGKPFESSQILGIFGVLVIVLSAAAGIGIAIQQGLLTPPLQLAGLLALGLGLLAGALKYRHLDGPHFSLLGGAGLAILYIASYVSYEVLQLLPKEAALGLAMITSGIGVYAAHRFQQKIFGLIACVGTQFGPIVLGLTDPLGLSVYYMIWGCVFAYEAQRLKSMELLLASSFLALIVTSFQFDLMKTKSWLWVSLFTLPQLVIFTVSLAREKWDLAHFKDRDFQFVLVILAALYYLQIHNYLPKVPWASPFHSLLILLFGLVLIFNLARVTPHGHSLRYFFATFFIASFYFDFFVPYPRARDIMILPALGLGFYLSQHKEWRDLGKIFLGVFGLMFAYINVGYIVNIEGSGTLHAAIILNLYTLIGYGLIYAFRKHEVTGKLLYIPHIIAMRTIIELSPNRVVVSLAWSALAIAILIAAKRLSYRALGASSLVVFFCSGMKLIFYDLDSSQSMLQVGSGIVFGLSMWLGGLLLKSIK